VIEDGHLVIPTAPGWGADIDEAVLREHPWPRRDGASARLPI